MRAAAARAAVVISLLVAGFVLGAPDSSPVLAHEQTVLVAASGAGRCPSGVQNCTVTWTHVNSWTHYTATVPLNCTVDIIDQCGIRVTSTSATSSCRSSSNCGHGPHSSSPRPAGPGTWTRWKGHRNTNYRWSGQRQQQVEHEHGEQNLPSPTPSSTPRPTPVVTPLPTPSPTPTPTPTPIFDPSDIDWNNFNPCANGGCLPPCFTDGIPGSCPWETQPPPDPKVCTTAWGSATGRELLSRLRWESIVPYDAGFTGFHHPEAPGGRFFLTAASTADGPARHWTARQRGTTLDVVDAPQNGCLWTATSVGVLLRELLPYVPSDLATLRLPGNSAAAVEARQAADLWDRLSPERQQWFQAAFPRTDPATVWCSPADLPPWTIPADAVLSLSSHWEDRYGSCRWTIPRRGFWEWQLQVRYTSEQGGHHTETLAADLSWFREPTGYLGQQVTLW